MKVRVQLPDLSFWKKYLPPAGGAPVKSVIQANRGISAVVRKEAADHLGGNRFLILFLLVAVTGLAATYVAASNIRAAVGESETEFVFLRLFTASGSTMPPFTSFLSFLGPLVGLAMGFDAINGEKNRRTLSRVLSQPIYRDALINGKFLAGIIVLAMMIFSLGLIVAGMGLILTGVPPTLEEILRILSYLLISVVYVAFWLALSMLFSLLFRQTSTSALAGIAVWLFFAIFASLLAGMAADAVYPVTGESTAQQQLAHERLKQGLSRLSPTTLYDEATATLLNPSVRTLGPILLQQAIGAIEGPLSVGQSLLLVWPHIVGLAAATMICFAVAYIVFMRQEIRA